MAGLNVIALFGVFITIIATSSVSGADIKCRHCKKEYGDFSLEESLPNFGLKHVPICNKEENQIESPSGTTGCVVLTIWDKTTNTSALAGQFTFAVVDYEGATQSINKDLLKFLDNNKYESSFYKCSKDLCSDDMLRIKCRMCKREYGDFSFEKHLPEFVNAIGPDALKSFPICNNKKKTEHFYDGFNCGVLTIWDVTSTGIIAGQIGLNVQNVNVATDITNKALKSTDKLKYMHSFSTCSTDFCSDRWLLDRIKCRRCKREYGDFSFEKHLPGFVNVYGPDNFRNTPNCNNKEKQSERFDHVINCGVLTIWDVTSTSTGIIVGQISLKVWNVEEATDKINKALNSTDKLKYMHSLSTCSTDDLCSDVWLQDRSPRQ